MTSGRHRPSRNHKEKLTQTKQAMAPQEEGGNNSETAGSRNELKRQVSEPTEERPVYLHKKMAEAGGGRGSLDDKIYRAVREQAGKLGMSYEADAPAY